MQLGNVIYVVTHTQEGEVIGTVHVLRDGFFILTIKKIK